MLAWQWAVQRASDMNGSSEAGLPPCRRCEEQSGSVSGSAGSPEWTDLERTRWLLVLNCHTGLPQTAYGKALTPNVAWSIYEPSADLSTVQRWGRYVTRSHVFQESRPTPPPPPGFLPAGSSGSSPFSCLVYSSSSTHNPLRAGGPSLATLCSRVSPAAENRAGVELHYLGLKLKPLHQMWKAMDTCWVLWRFKWANSLRSWFCGWNCDASGKQFLKKE